MKKLAILFVLLIFALSLTFADNPAGSNTYEIAGFGELNGLTYSAGGEAIYTHYYGNGFGTVFGASVQAVTALYGNDETSYYLGAVKPMITPFIMAKLKKFELGGGFSVLIDPDSDKNPFYISPYIRGDFHIDFSQDSGKSTDRKMGMMIGGTWYYNSNSKGNIADELADIFVNILVPKVHVGFTYMFETGKENSQKAEN